MLRKKQTLTTVIFVKAEVISEAVEKTVSLVLGHSVLSAKREL